jgi:hypothetical protein
MRVWRCLCIAMMLTAWTGAGHAALFHNGLFGNALYSNALQANALWSNALFGNSVALDRLLVSGLNSATFSGDALLNRQLADPAARIVLEYLVRCALEPGDVLEIQDLTFYPPRFEPMALTGSAGLCPGWAVDGIAQKPACQELVSACLVAASNYTAASVPLSLRGTGEAGEVLPLEQEVPGVTRYPKRSFIVESLRPCGRPTSGASRNCGWRVKQVGTCGAGEPILVKAMLELADVDSDVRDDGVVLRICPGTAACDHGQGQEGAGQWIARAQISCPAQEHFTVMAAPLRAAAYTGPITVSVEEGGYAYPAPEDAVFWLREGAFFGNLFSASAAHPDVEITANGEVVGSDFVVDGPAFPDAFMCASAEWATATAYARDRICGGETRNCVAIDAGRCEEICEDGSPGGAYGPCRNPYTNERKPAITTFLTRPCTGLTREEHCDRPTPSPLEVILAFFDRALETGELQGTGRGRSAANRARALRSMIEGSKGSEQPAEAGPCGRLSAALSHTDGDSRPPDLVAGTAAKELERRLETLLTSLSCPQAQRR